jgi:hypothetical protein
MGQAKRVRLLMAAVLAAAVVTQSANAQTTAPPPNTPPLPVPQRESDNKVIWYFAGAAAALIISALIGIQLFPDPPPPDRSPPPTLPPDPPPVGPASLGPLPPRQLPKTPQVARTGFNVPPPGETRFVPNEVLLDIPSSVSIGVLDAIAARHAMVRLETHRFALTGRTLHRWRIDGGGTVPDMIRGLTGETRVAGAQPNYLYELAQQPLPAMNSDQYAPEKLNLQQAHQLATGNRVLVAVIDSGVDTAHPDLAGAISENFDAAGGDARPHAHGTGMAGAIAARRSLMSVAPRVGLLTVRAFGAGTGADGTSFNILKGLDWAVGRGARVVNMSFAGPADPRLRDALAKASARGIVLVAAAGNAGPRAPPLYPAADANVIAVTATDSDDAVYDRANRGNHIAVAAPGVDILVPGVGGDYQFTTGTSVAAAHVSGVAALLLERNPSLRPLDVRRILATTARTLGKGRQNEGAGLVDAYRAVTSVKR